MSVAEDSTRPEIKWWHDTSRKRLQHLLSVSFQQDDSTTVTRTRDCLDVEITAMALATCAMKTHRNTLIAINKLPAELLAQCFRWLVDLEPLAGVVGSFNVEDWDFDEKEYDVRLQYPAPALGWMKATHVCSLWREIAVNEPTLWWEPSFRLRGDCTEVMISRARSVPLTVACDPRSRSDRQRAQSILEPKMQQVAQLSILGNDTIVRTLVEATLGRDDLPRLTSLSLSYSSDNFYMDLQESIETEEISPPPRTLFTTAFAANTPNINRLLFNETPPPDLLSISQLTNLAYFSMTSPSPSISMRQLSELLESMPRLKGLTLERCLPALVTVDPPQVDTPVPSHVHLRELRFLNVKESKINVESFLKFVHIPTATRIRLQLTQSRQPSSEALDAAIDTIHAAFASSQRQMTMRTMWLHIGYGPHGLEVKLTGSHELVKATANSKVPAPPKSPAFQSCLLSAGEEYNAPTAAALFLQRDFHGVEILHLEFARYYRRLDVWALPRFLQGMPNLHDLSITLDTPLQYGILQSILFRHHGSFQADVSHRLPKALTLGPRFLQQSHIRDAGGDSDQEGLCLPHLQTFVLNGIAANPVALAKEELLLALTSRLESHPGAALRELLLVNCSDVDVAFEGRLRGVVPLVECRENIVVWPRRS